VIWVLGLLALCGQVGEGSAGDWSAVYLHVDLGTSAGAAAVALGAFSVTMAAGRVAGDRLAARFGPVRLVRGAAWSPDWAWRSACCRDPGRGHRRLRPARAGPGRHLPADRHGRGRLDPQQAGRNIGRIAAVSYTGLLSGPVAIGLIASGVGLRDALLVPAALALLVAATAGVMKRRRPVNDRPGHYARAVRGCLCALLPAIPGVGPIAATHLLGCWLVPISECRAP
jgi:MFS family permease